MKMHDGGIKNLLNIKFNPEILSEEEAKNIIEEDGINAKLMEDKFGSFYGKINFSFNTTVVMEKKEEYNSKRIDLS